MTSDYLKRLDVQGHLRVKEALREWDPIGVYGPGIRCPDDEYDAYAGPVIRLLDAGAPKEEILRYLKSVCVDSIEVSFDRKRSEKIVDELLVFWPEWKKKIRELGPHYIQE